MKFQNEVWDSHNVALFPLKDHDYYVWYIIKLVPEVPQKWFINNGTVAEAGLLYVIKFAMMVVEGSLNHSPVIKIIEKEHYEETVSDVSDGVLVLLLSNHLFVMVR